MLITLFESKSEPSGQHHSLKLNSWYVLSACTLELSLVFLSDISKSQHINNTPYSIQKPNDARAGTVSSRRVANTGALEDIF